MYFLFPGSSSTVHIICKYPVLLVVITIIAGVYVGFIPIEQRCEKQSFVSFTFDDGYSEVYNIAFPILDKYGYTGAVFVTTDTINQYERLTQFQLLELQSVGWEIGSHGVTHTDLTTITPTNRQYEIVNSMRVLKSMGIDVKTIATPYGSYNDDVINDIKTSGYNAHRTARNNIWILNNIPVDNPYYIEGVVITSNTTVEKAKEEILRANYEHKWLVIVFHKFDRGGEYSYNSKDFEEIVKYTHSLERIRTI